MINYPSCSKAELSAPPNSQAQNMFRVIAIYLREKSKMNDVKAKVSMSPYPFQSAKPVPIGVDTYLYHLVSKIVTSPAVLIIMLIYIDKFISRD